MLINAYSCNFQVNYKDYLLWNALNWDVKQTFESRFSWKRHEVSNERFRSTFSTYFSRRIIPYPGIIPYRQSRDILHTCIYIHLYSEILWWKLRLISNTSFTIECNCYINWKKSYFIFSFLLWYSLFFHIESRGTTNCWTHCSFK